MGFQPVLEVTRGGLVESIHFGVVVVADPSGRIWAQWGDPETVTFLRSSAKPFQCLPLLESGAADHYGLKPKQIAVICASHSGTDEHVQTVASIQTAIGVTQADLMCGVHPPYNNKATHKLKDEGLDPTPNRHNCSGKHSGMLGLARFVGASIENYIDRDHPVQRLILETLAEMCGLDAASVSLAIDGCSVPTFGVPLRASATAYARLMDPSGLSAGRREACRRVVSAMTSHSDMVAGPDRFDTRLMEVTKKRLLSKGGAEGNQAIGIPPGALEPNSSALGIAIKVADGDLGGRATAAASIGVLEALGAIDAAEREALADFGPKPILNFRGLTVGHSRICFQLEQGT